MTFKLNVPNKHEAMAVVHRPVGSMLQSSDTVTDTQRSPDEDLAHYGSSTFGAISEKAGGAAISSDPNALSTTGENMLADHVKAHQKSSNLSEPTTVKLIRTTSGEGEHARLVANGTEADTPISQEPLSASPEFKSNAPNFCVGTTLASASNHGPASKASSAIMASSAVTFQGDDNTHAESATSVKRGARTLGMQQDPDISSLTVLPDKKSRWTSHDYSMSAESAIRSETPAKLQPL